MSSGAPRFGILAVCTANICRSPLIEVLLRAQLDSSRFEVASAGVQGWDRKPMDSMAAMELQRLGHSAEGFRSQAINSYFVDSSDLILTATRAHRSDVLGLNPQALRRSFTLVEFAALSSIVSADSPAELVAQAALRRSLAPAEVDIGDPYRRGPEVHRATADQIAEAVATITARLNALVGAEAVQG
ncbi:low molecular weight phosphatase family protein [Aeromicrobium chenweiae]|uniref:protein-tyrosine-phosphatase n=1 Tax=Aeromicrobium chenweiae TaxID=2079793 RepID=A0A2S0WIP1_9ACTN|nr:low molecular weight phosphatase family protein [Aeromicrobium chenweiae]AWB91209.1 low molecular weight phosphatase family protein [Aeromicrobium chenweiae]TGN31728.1 low molecular weight phosphatase family protein [Aeromicrobium chenweiae]